MNQRIKTLRMELGLTQTAFADKIGITGAAITRMEKGDRNPSEQTIISICREFGVNEEWLRSGEGNMFIELTEMQKVMRYTGLLLKDTDSVIAKAVMDFIVTYEQLDDTSKKVLNEVAQKYLENSKRSKK